MSRKYKFHNPDGIYFITPTIIGWVDIFTRNSYFEIIIDSLKYCQLNKGLVIHAYVIMPSHLHLFISRRQSDKLEDIIRDFKRHTSIQIRKEMDEISDSRNKWMKDIFIQEGIKNSNNLKFQLWQQHNHPIELVDNNMIDQRMDYLHENPINAGYVDKPECWNYSSAGEYAGMKGMLKIELID